MRALNLLYLSNNILEFLAFCGRILHDSERILQLVKSFFEYRLALEILHRGGVGQLGHGRRIDAAHMRAARAAVEEAGETACCLVNYRLCVLADAEALAILVIK